MITIVGPGGDVTYRSPSACRFLGIDPETGPEIPLDYGLFEEDRPLLAALFERLRLEPGRSETIRYRFQREDGELRWIEMIATNHSDDPAVLGVVTNARDVTDRVEAEQSVRASEERLRGLVANISDVISVIDANGVLQYTSPASEQVYGYKDGAWPEGQSIFDTVHPEDRDRILELWEGAHSTPRSVPPTRAAPAARRRFVDAHRGHRQQPAR